MLSEERFSLAHLSMIEQSIPNLIKIAGEAGYDYVSPRLLSVTEAEDRHEFLKNPKIIADCKNLLNDSHLSILSSTAQPSPTQVKFRFFAFLV